MSALQTMAYILRFNKPASEILDCFELYPQILKNLPIDSKPNLEGLEGYGTFLKGIASKKIRHLIRYSGTENKLRILLEGKDLKLLENTMQECEAYFKGKIYS